jgi:hypothetical protein
MALVMCLFAIYSCIPVPLHTTPVNYKVDFNKLEELHEHPKEVFELSGFASGSFKGKADRDSLEQVSSFHSVLIFNQEDIDSHLMTMV